MLYSETFYIGSTLTFCSEAQRKHSKKIIFFYLSSNKKWDEVSFLCLLVRGGFTASQDIKKLGQKEIQAPSHKSHGTAYSTDAVKGSMLDVLLVCFIFEMLSEGSSKRNWAVFSLAAILVAKQIHILNKSPTKCSSYK